MTDKNKRLDLIPSEDLLKDFTKLTELTPEQIQILADELNTKEGFGFHKKTNLKEFIGKLGTKPDDFNSAFRLAYYIHQRATEEKADGNAVIEALLSITQEDRQVHWVQNSAEQLKNLLTPLPQQYQRRKLETYGRGLQFNLHSVSTTCELRAIFPFDDDDDDGDEQDLEGVLPVMTIRLVGKNDKDEDKSFVFTANRKSFDKLMKHLKKADQKLKSLESSYKSVSIINFEE